jgi:polyhydroxybutyrate depolymerase
MRAVLHAAAFALLGLLTQTSAAFADCGPQAGPCTIPSGTYHAVLPPTGATPAPAVLFLHGWGGDGAGALTNRGMVNALIARGYAVIAVDGIPRASGSGRSWAFHPDREAPRDDVAFVAEVADDAAARFGLDRDRMILSGFSVGGSMVSYAACRAPGAFSAYAPISGSFWRPLPDSCAGPVRLFHIHGWTDGTVPLEGRRIGGIGIQQGDVFQSMDIWRTSNGCTRPNPDGFGTIGDTQLRRWDESCTPGSSLVMALHPGGHKVPKGWADMMLDWYEGLSASQ